MAALEGRFPKEDQAIYALDAWPGGQAPYLFGEAFLRRLTRAVGPGHAAAAGACSTPSSFRRGSTAARSTR